MRVQVVTDSTSDISHDLAEELGIRVVPIYVRFDDKTYRDGVDIQSKELYQMLSTLPTHPATSQPSPEDFTNTYKEYCDTADGIVSIHISSKISGTCSSAMLAKNMLGKSCLIEVVDSKFNSAGLGLVATAAARLAKSGAGFREVVDEANKAIKQIGMFGMFETMKYLARGGRVSKTIVMASRILNVMPLLTFKDGEITRAGLVRTISKGMDKIYQFVSKNTPISELVIVHSAVLERAQQLKQRLGDFINSEKIVINELGAGLGVHGGPGVLLAAIRRAEIG